MKFSNESPSITVFLRRSVAEGDPEKYRADIIGEDFGHHAAGKTPSEALSRAAAYWHKHSGAAK